ncbi:unnamed protein product [Eruca vesicaria subsp. sativa]|uniref:Uncharacterized protein n=1 Tax=Eruca vesicaria subsp. sativa TaxID=29727 RepID=A0ABC8JXB7_ERUVS|nr:unnamed protein product [Eruca vesicaria subsp. sativa]
MDNGWCYNKNSSGRLQVGSVSELREKLNRVNSENKKLTEMLETVYENYYILHHHLEKLQSRSSHEIDMI